MTPRLAEAVGINEIRIDNPSADTDEFFELDGTPNESLDGLTYLVIGDGAAAAGSGVIENVTSLTGLSLDAGGYFAAHKAGTVATCSGYDAELILNFENTDNVTHLLVRGFTGSNGDDQDTDDDGVLDIQPWTSIEDCVAVLDDASGGDLVHCTTTVGPDGSSAPFHVYRCGTNIWNIGSDAACTDDTPGDFNPCTAFGTRISEIRVDNPGADTDEYFELRGVPNTDLSSLTYLVIGDGGATGSGVVESVTHLTGQTLGSDGFLAVHKQGTTAACSGYDVELSLNFENDDNVTHMLVVGFSGSVDLDLDVDDNGVDQEPWQVVLDCVALMQSLSTGDLVYCLNTVGPDAGSTPAHVFSCDGTWAIGVFDICALDTPGDENLCATAAPSRLPSAVTLLQNQPNPFNPATRIQYHLDQPAMVSLQVYDLAGRLVTTLVKGVRPAGDHVSVWQGTDGSGGLVSSGVYLYRLRTAGNELVRRMVLLK